MPLIALRPSLEVELRFLPDDLTLGRLSKLPGDKLSPREFGVMTSFQNVVQEIAKGLAFDCC